MSLLNRSFRRSVFCLLWIVSGVCAAQQGAPTQINALKATHGDAGKNSLAAASPGNPVVPGSPTTTGLYLCAGPTAACPSTGGIQPPLALSLTMVYGQTYNGTAVVTPSDGSAVPGNMNYYDLYNGTSTLLCTIQTSTLGTCPPSVGMGATAGVHVFTAVYFGDTLHTGSTSNAVTVNVLQGKTVAGMVGVPSTSLEGQPVTFTATLAGEYAPPAGQVVFMNGTTVLGSVNLTPGSAGLTSTATLTTSTLAAGTDPITVRYGGTMNFAAAVAATTQTIAPLGSGSFTISVTPNPVTLGMGYGTVLTVTVTARNGFMEGVNLGCGSLPAEAACTFGNAAIAPGGGSTMMFLNTAAPHTCGTNQPYFLGGNGDGPGMAPFALPAVAGFIVIFVPGKGRWLRAIVAIVAVGGAVGITGCGDCTDLGTRPATYTIHVTGMAAAGTPEVESQAVTLKVTI